MTETKPGNLEFGISRCQQAYQAFQQLASRTDDALYQALGQVHSLQYRMQSDATLQAEFETLLRLHAASNATNQTLFLVKYAFFPHTLRPGPGHKRDITKASRYAKLINKALAKDIQPVDFVTFARAEGIQKTALAPASGKRRPIGKASPRRAKPAAADALDMAAPGFLAAALSPTEPWFYSTHLAERLTGVLREAQSQPQKVTLTVYVNNERAVVTGIAAQTLLGKFPPGEIRISTSTPAQMPAAVETQATSMPPQVSRPYAGERKRALPSLHPTRRSWRRRADGYIWPSWR